MNKTMLAAALGLAMAAPEAPAVAQSMRILGGLSNGSTPNRYKPHQGAREKARRLRQLQRHR